MIPPRPRNPLEPDLSIVIVNWNTVGLLRACLASVEAGGGKLGVETIVVDNGSTDGSPEMVASEFPDVVLIRNDDNRGFAPANNQGIEVARGRHVLLLNSDTVVLGSVLPAAVRYLDDHLDVGALGCRVLNPDRTLQPTCFRFPSLANTALLLAGLSGSSSKFGGREHYGGWARDDERDVDVITGCFLMVPRSVIDEVGPLDESFFFFGEETDWCRRIADAGWHVRFAPVGEIVHVGGASARKLDHKRDLLLTTGLVRVMAKHRGRAIGETEAAMLWLFNASRAAGWAAVSTIAATGRRPAARARRDHFVQVVRQFGDARRQALAGV